MFILPVFYANYNHSKEEFKSTLPSASHFFWLAECQELLEVKSVKLDQKLSPVKVTIPPKFPD